MWEVKRFFGSGQRRPHRSGGSQDRFAEFFPEGDGDIGRYELIDITSKTGDFLHETGTDVGEFFPRHEEHGFEMRIEFPVHEGELELELEVGNGAKTADDGGGILFPGEIDQEAAERDDAEVRNVGGGSFQESDSLLDSEEALLGVVAGNRDDEFIEEPGGPMQEVKVTVGDGIETPRVYRAPHDVDCSGLRGLGKVKGRGGGGGRVIRRQKSAFSGEVGRILRRWRIARIRPMSPPR